MKLVTLGRFTLQGGDFNRPKLWLLLAFLAMEGPQNRRYLAELFWGTAADPMANLRVATASLRNRLPGVLVNDGSRLAAHLITDSATLLCCLAAGDDDAAVTGYNGAFLQGVRIPVTSPDLEEWVCYTRESLADRVVEAHIRIGERAGANGDCNGAMRHGTLAWNLPGRSPLIADHLTRIHALLLLGNSPLLSLSKREAAVLGMSLAAEQPPTGSATEADLAALAARLLNASLLTARADGSFELAPQLAAAVQAQGNRVPELRAVQDTLAGDWQRKGSA